MGRLATHVIMKTSHLQRTTAEMMEEMGPDEDRLKNFGDWRDDIVVCQYAYGYWVKLPYDDPDDPEESAINKISRLPKDLRECMTYALQFNAKWILFDRDEDGIGILTDYHW